MHPSSRWLALAFCSLALGCPGPDPAPDAPSVDAGTDVGADAGAAEITTVRVLAFNDLHGALAITPYLASEITARRTPNTFVVSAGDLIGGSPIASGAFHDQPTIEIANAFGLDFAAVGNHELDEGRVELERMQNGGCHPVDGCSGDGTFAGASFEFLAANTVNDDTGDTIFPPYAVRDVEGVRIAFVGMTLEDTPSTTLASAIPELSFGDEVETMRALATELEAAGVDVMVLVLHEGGGQLGGPNDCVAPGGPIFEIATALEGVLPLIVSGHSHSSYVCELGGVTVTGAGANGQLLTQIDIQFDRITASVVDVRAENVAISDSLAADPDVAAIVEAYEALIAPVRDAVVGTITADFLDPADLDGESLAGGLVADAMLAGTVGAGAQIALMNTGGIRASFSFARSGSETEDGSVTYGECFRVQPFASSVRTVSITGAQLVAILDAWVGDSAPLQVAGLTYAWRASGAPGTRVAAGDVTVGGAPLVPTDTYRVTVNSIVGDPGRSPSIAGATDIVGAGVDIDLLIAYFESASPLTPAIVPRITRLP